MLSESGSISAASVPGYPTTSAFGARNNFAITAQRSITVLPPPSTKRSGVAEPNHTLMLRRDIERYRDEDDSSAADGESPKKTGALGSARRASINPEDYMFDPRD